MGRLHRQAGALIDLPGIYSLHPMSRDESVAVQYLLDELPNAIVNVVDASQLERNLMLTVQLLEYGVPVYVALNMTDVAAGRGIHIDPAKLSSALGVPVIPVNARKKQGIASILERLQTQTAEGIPYRIRLAGAHPEEDQHQRLRMQTQHHRLDMKAHAAARSC